MKKHSFLVPLRQDLSQNLGLGWSPASPHNPSFSTVHSTGAVAVHSHVQLFLQVYWGLELGFSCLHSKHFAQ